MSAVVPDFFQDVDLSFLPGYSCAIVVKLIEWLSENFRLECLNVIGLKWLRIV